MLRVLTLFFSFFLITANASADNPKVKIDTNLGTIVLTLNADKAPVTVANFLQYVDSGYYKDVIFHRVIKGFMVQGGGFTQAFQKKDTKAPIKNEADNGLKNERGTIAMARTGDPHSASAQFFLNSVDNARLDHKAKTMQGWGYTVFGRVVEGMDVVDKISDLPTAAGGPFGRDVPQKTVLITSISRVE